MHVQHQRPTTAHRSAPAVITDDVPRQASYLRQRVLYIDPNCRTIRRAAPAGNEKLHTRFPLVAIVPVVRNQNGLL